jgi:two-component system, OmpR family, KDP operon response regulator KdpE
VSGEAREPDNAAAVGTVLIVEDEQEIVRFLRAALTAAGYETRVAVTGKEGLKEAATRAPDLVILDLGLPDLDGIEVTRRLREWSRVPIVVLSARGQERDKVEALDAGADDYLTKPFAVGELLARLRVAARHALREGPGAEVVLEIGALRIDRGRHEVTVAGALVHLTPTEFKLLATLARVPGRVVTHAQLLREVWGPRFERQHHYLRVHMGNLRHKLEPEPSRPTYLLTEPGVGYRLRESIASE